MSRNMSDKRVAKALGAIRGSGMAGIGWALSMAMMLLRANLKLIFSLNRPALLFTGRMAVLQGMRHAQIGQYARIARYARITAWKQGHLSIGNYFSLGEGSIIENGFNIAARKGSIEIGDNVGIGALSFISCASHIRLGSDCIIGQYFSIHPQNHIFTGPELIRLQGTTELGVVIGNNCWIGAKVTILDGTRVGSGCVIAAGAVVSGTFPDRCVIGGCPARILKMID